MQGFRKAGRSKKYLYFWLTVFALLEGVDLITTYAAGISCEANPLVVWVWARYGLWPFAVAKVLILLYFVFTWWLLGKLASVSPFDPLRSRKVFRTILVIEALVPIAAVCLWNSYQILS